jgi:hypothetical protein
MVRSFWVVGRSYPASPFSSKPVPKSAYADHGNAQGLEPACETSGGVLAASPSGAKIRQAAAEGRPHAGRRGSEDGDSHQDHPQRRTWREERVYLGRCRLPLQARRSEVRGAERSAEDTRSEKGGDDGLTDTRELV